MKKLKIFKNGSFSGLVAGLLNGLLGAGGGMVIVPMLEKNGLKPTEAHATSIAIIVPLCIMSASIYLFKTNIKLADVLPFLPAGLIGSYIGAKVLPKIPSKILRRIFGAFMLYASWRLLFPHR